MRARTEATLAVAGVYAISAGLWALLFAVGGWIACLILAAVVVCGTMAFFSWIITGHPVPPEDER